MKRFLILILFSLIFPIQNSSAVSPSLDETLEFLVNGENKNKMKWSMDDNCVLKIDHEYKDYLSDELKRIKKIIYLNKINLKKGVSESKVGGSVLGFMMFGEGVTDDIEKGRIHDYWSSRNYVKSLDRNVKALSHLFSNFCTGFKSAF
ncbi:hypothetical protein N9434_00205 [Candidatus Pelagibacter sp.]|nr:hypothetical protein [Candidatus Pelagibacter sp.]